MHFIYENEKVKKMNIYAYIDAVALMLLLLLFSVCLVAAAAALVNDILLRDSDSDDVTQIMQFFRHNFNSFSVLVINRMPIRIPCRISIVVREFDRQLSS